MPDGNAPVAVCFDEVVCERERDETVVVQHSVNNGVFISVCDTLDEFGRDRHLYIADSER